MSNNALRILSDSEDDEEELLIERLNKLRMKKLLNSVDSQKKFIDERKSCLLTDIQFNNNSIKSITNQIEELTKSLNELETENKEFGEKLETLESLDYDEEDVVQFIKDEYNEEFKEFVEREEEDKKKKVEVSINKQISKPKVAAEKDEERSKKYKDRKDEWNSYPEGTKFLMTFRGTTLRFIKCGNVVVRVKDNKVYKSLNDAMKKYLIENNINYSFGSAWKYFKVCNNVDEFVDVEL